MTRITRPASGEPQRLFIALPTAPETRNALRAYQQTLRSLGLQGSETRPENLHLTLSFLGGQSDPAPIIRAMQAVPAAGPISLLLDRPGRFRQKDGALLWLGSERDRPVQRLASALEDALREQGFSPEARQFLTHITLFRRVKNDSVLPRLPEICIPYRAETMVLYRSHRPGGVLTYTPLFVRELSAAPGRI